MKTTGGGDAVEFAFGSAMTSMPKGNEDLLFKLVDPVKDTVSNDLHAERQ